MIARLLIGSCALTLALLPLQARAQMSAFTAEGERVYLYGNGSWSTEPDLSFSDLLEMELQQARPDADKDHRCTLIFGLRNGFAVNLQEVAAEVQFLDPDGQYLLTRRVTFKNPRAGKVRFAEAQMQLADGCTGFNSFDVVDVPTCRMDDGTKIEDCFQSFSIVED